MKSIRRKLVLLLVAALAGGMTVVVAATYFFAYSQITRVFDEELVRVAEAVHLGEDWQGPERVRIPHQGFNLSVRAYDRSGALLFATAEPSMPADLPLLFDTGHRLFDTLAGKWRVYSHESPEGIVQVGQPEATRTSLARSLSMRMALPELALIPFFAAFMAWMLGRGLTPLSRISRRVEERDVARLEPERAGRGGRCDTAAGWRDPLVREKPVGELNDPVMLNRAGRRHVE